MDLPKLAQIFKGTIDPNQREAAEKQLDQIHKIIGFVPAALQLVMDSSLEMPVRQAAAIYLKNQVVSNWPDKEPAPGQGPALLYSIHEQDRGMVRGSIVDAIVHSPDLIRVHLAVCVNHIVKHDFPEKWPGIVDKLVVYLQMEDAGSWMGAFLALYQLVKNFEYKSHDGRAPLVEALNLILPMVYQNMTRLLPDGSEQSVLLQKQVLKIFYALVQYSLPLNLLSNDVFSQWMEIFRQIVDRPVPVETSQIDDEEKPELAWWKAKKWAMHILARVFERYGIPGNVHKEYRQFADWYIHTFSLGIIQVMLKVLEQYGNKVFVAPRVLQQALNYLCTCVNHSFTWRMIKNHMALIIQNILFPLMCYTEEDERLWQEDQQEYIRTKFDVFEDYVSPVIAAQSLLHNACKKRKDMLPRTIGFAIQVLNDGNNTPQMKDGALHMIGAVADILLKKDSYKNQMEDMLIAYVFPHFESPHGFLRARACWVLHYFENIRFAKEENLVQALNYLQKCLLHDQEWPVKVEAAISVQVLLSSQPNAQQIVEPNITQITLELLKVIRQTENEDLTNVMQKIVCMYSEKLIPIAYDMTHHLEETFIKVMESTDEDDSEDKALAAMGILNTIDTILTMMDKKEILSTLEPIVIRIANQIFDKEMMELYEEGFNLVSTATMNDISNDMWQIFEKIYQVFNKDGFDYFTDMMPALHNFITVAPKEAFLSNRNHVVAIYNICKAILESDAGEEAECHAAKLLEVTILQFKGQIDEFIMSFVQLALTRLTREIKTDDLKTICMQVIIAALFYNPQLLFNILNQLQPANSNQSILNHFVTQWMNDTHCFLGLHDRKMCVLGLCTLMALNSNQRPAIINEIAPQIVPSALSLFEGLKEAYKAQAENENETDDSDSEEETDDDESDVEDLEDDQDHVNTNSEYKPLDQLVRQINQNCPFPVTSATVMDEDDDEESDIDSDEEDDDCELTALESYTTAIDDKDSPDNEYVMFKELLETIQQSDPNWYNVLVSQLNAQQHSAIQEVFTLANRRKAERESRMIEKHGGYQFASHNIPTSFNFGGAPPHS